MTKGSHVDIIIRKMWTVLGVISNFQSSYEHSMVAQEFEFSLNGGTSKGAAVSFSTLVEVEAPFCSVLGTVSCGFVSSQLILNRVTRGSEASMFRTT